VEHDLARAFDAARGCDLFLAVGTSLVVGPINQMFVLAARSGAATAILTASETPFDDAATWRLREPVQTVLPALRDRLLGAGTP
jgi:NAD-dependent deacetylase